MKKYKLLALVISVIVSAGLLLWMLMLISNIHTIDKEGVGLGNFKNVEEIMLTPDSVFNQEIFSTQNELTKLTISLKTTKPTILSLKLQGGNQIVRQHLINIPQLNHVQFIEWLFNPITNSSDKKYNLQIKTDNQIILYTVEPARYDGGKLYINGLENKQQRIIIDWEYFTTHPINTLINRITYAKPGIFNNTSTIIVLFIFFWFLNFLLFFYITKFFLKNRNEKN